MEFEAKESQLNADWFCKSSGIYVRFAGASAKALAHEYAAFKNGGSHLEPPMTNARVLARLGERRDATYTIAETIAILDAITLCRLQGAR